jgi:hypothetical protein
LENQDIWVGSIMGVLSKDKNGEFYLQCEISGKVTIGKGYDAYPNSFRKV